MPRRSRPPAGFVPSRKIDGIRRSTGWPISSSAAQPNITSTARLAKTIIPRASAETMPCVAVSSSVRSVAIVFLVATRLESILSPAAFGDVHVEPGEPRDSAVGVAVGSAPALDPCHCSVGPHDPERVLPRILGCRRQDLVQQCERARTVVVVHARHPRVRCRGIVGRKTVQRAESLVPVDLIGRGDPGP